MARSKKKTGVSLAKGPVALVGLALLAYGITAFLLGGHSFQAHPLGGTVNGKTWLGLEVNAWTSLLFIAAGALLVFAAPAHWAAKSMSLIVGLALGAAALIGLYDKTDVFGIFAANGPTKLAWGQPRSCCCSSRCCRASGAASATTARKRGGASPSATSGASTRLRPNRPASSATPARSARRQSRPIAGRAATAGTRLPPPHRGKAGRPTASDWELFAPTAWPRALRRRRRTRPVAHPSTASERAAPDTDDAPFAGA
jgi:hypothetical protein